MRVQLHFRLLLVLVAQIALASRSASAAEDGLPVQFRRPVAATVMNGGQRLLVANQRSGSLSIIDLDSRRVISETRVGTRLSSLVGTGDPARFLLTDEATHELLLVRVSDADCQVEQRQPVSPYPVGIKVSEDGATAFIASLWSRTITVVDLINFSSPKENRSFEIKHQIRLPFAPREMLVLSAGDLQSRIPSLVSSAMRLLVTDAFGARMAVLNPAAGKIESVREIPAHAIRGLHLHPDRPQVVVSHQLLSRLAQSTFEEVHWGALMINVLRTIDLADLIDPSADLLKKSVLEYLGGPDHGAGDPGAFVMRSDGVSGIVLRGTDELLILDENHVYGGRVETGHFPTAITMHPDGKFAYVLNTLSDSITVVQLSGPIVVDTISLGTQPELTPADRGERLFHSAKLSHDNWISCASCHVDGHTNGQLNDNKTDGSFGTAKRVLTLRGIGDTAPYSWNGRFKTLGEQISHSVRSTMQGSPLTETQTADLKAYLKTLPPAPALGNRDHQSVKRGAAIFESQNCAECHTPPLFTSAVIADVGLQDEQGDSRFNPPSLRGVSQNGPYFHDGRAASLKQIFADHRHQLDRKLTDAELEDLISFLNDL